MRAPKPVSLISKNLTKEEKSTREENEKRLNGNAKKVYRVPKKLPLPVAKIYKELVNQLKEADILSDLDIELLITTANAIHRMNEARKHIEEFGAVITTYNENGDIEAIKKNPSIQIEKDYQAIFHTGCLQLGLSPSSRAKLSIMKIEKQEGESKEDKLFG